LQTFFRGYWVHNEEKQELIQSRKFKGTFKIYKDITYNKKNFNVKYQMQTQL